MARIPEGELTRLKAEVSVLRLVEAAGIELKRHSRRVEAYLHALTHVLIRQRV